MLIKILLNDAFLKGTADINEFRFAFSLDVFQLVAHTLLDFALFFFSPSTHTLMIHVYRTKCLWASSH